ncbi:MAG: hypothetical protein K0S76_2721 [Herbinix sp.]|jgi:predicted MPP superfamily phosphohydrolase|nr:hypothetical protein [Herbinix sp.]
MQIVAGLFILIALWAMIEQNLLTTTKFTITNKKLGKDFDPTSIVVLSDLHNHTFGKNNKRLVSKIERLSPDFIIVAGDMANKDQGCIPSNAYSLMELLAKKYKIYYALGNHEQYLIEKLNREVDHRNSTQSQGDSTWVEYRKNLSKLGVNFLDNASVTITKNNNTLKITGVSIGREYFDRGNPRTMQINYLEDQLGQCDRSVFQLLIAHNPNYFKNYSDWGADLTISGHIHGGLIRLPLLGGILSPHIRFFPKYDAGKYTEADKKMIVSRGLGSHSIMFRLFNPPELIFIQLKK